MEEEKKDDVLPQVEEGVEPTPNEGSSSEEKKEEPSGEYTKEKFDGLMSVVQKEKLALTETRLEYERRLAEIEAKQQPEVSDEDRWFNYISAKLDEKRKAKEQAEEDAVKKELEQVVSTYPTLKGDDILERAIKYKTDLRTAAEILQDIQGVVETKTKLNQTEEEKKRKAGGLGGGGATTPQKGMTPYDPKLSMMENINRGMKELGG